MWRVLAIILQYLAFLLGAFSLYVGLFIYLSKGTIHNKLELDEEGLNATSPRAALLQAAIDKAKGYFHRLLSDSLFGLFHGNLLDAFLASAILSVASFLVIWLALITPTHLGTTWSDPKIVSGIIRDPYARWIVLGAVFLGITPLLLKGVLPGIVSVWTGMFRRAWTEMFRRSGSDKGREVTRRKGLFMQFGRILGDVYLAIMFPFLVVMLPTFALAILGWALFIVLVPLRLATRGVKAEVGHVGSLLIVVFNLTVSACLFLMLDRALSWQQLRQRFWFRQDLGKMLSACAAASFVFLVSLRFIRDGWCLRPPTPSQFTVPDLHSSIARYLAYSGAVYVVLSWGVLAVVFLLLLNRAAWPYIRRVISWAHKEGLPINRKGFVSAGLILLFLSTELLPYFWELTSNQNVETIEEWIHKSR